MEKIILASGSPRRQMLLKNYGFDITVIKPEFDESTIKETDPEKLVCALALGKNKCVNIQDSIILSADTVVTINGEILGKPINRADAEKMLSRLSGSTHTVYTGVCISSGSDKRLFCAKSDVTFYKLSKTQIQKYIDTGSPFDKAGGYGIQDDIAIGFVEKINGELSNVIGLPMGKVIEEIKSIQGEK